MVEKNGEKKWKKMMKLYASEGKVYLVNSLSKYFSKSLVRCLWACKIAYRIVIQEDMFRKTSLDKRH